MVAADSSCNYGVVLRSCCVTCSKKIDDELVVIVRVHGGHKAFLVDLKGPCGMKKPWNGLDRRKGRRTG